MGSALLLEIGDWGLEIGDLLRLWRHRPFAEIVLQQASVAYEDGVEG